MTPAPTAPHSPLPWRTSSHNPGVIYDKGSIDVALVEGGRVGRPDVDEANAALIVRAVNSHDGLVKAHERNIARLRGLSAAIRLIGGDVADQIAAKIDAAVADSSTALAEAGEA